MKIDEQIIEEIKTKANIVDVISKYIPVSKKGRNHVSVCPFHNDTNPSMKISEDNYEKVDDKSSSVKTKIYKSFKEKLENIKKYFPNCYICNLDGKVIVE